MVSAQAPPVRSVEEPIDNRARGLRISAWIRLCAGSFTFVPPTLIVASGVATSDGGTKLVAAPSTKSPTTDIDVGAPGDSDSTT